MTDRKNHWESVYGQKFPEDVSWYQEHPSLSLELIRHAQLSFDEPIIDVGGGASLLVDCLSEQGYTHIAVLDISASALVHTKKRLGDKARDLEWFVEDIVDFKPPHQFSLWHDRAVFHFLSDQSDRSRYVRVLKNAIKPNGQVIIAAFAIGGPAKCSGLDVVQYDADKLMAELGEEFELVEERNETHLTPAKKEQKFAYFRLVRKP